MRRAFEVTKTIRPGLTPRWSISEYTTIRDHYGGDIRKDSSGLSTSIDVAVNVGADSVIDALIEGDRLITEYIGTEWSI